jgi:dolichol-phosphate mannosyltransferase
VSNQGKNNLRITIAAPCYNEEAAIEAFLDALAPICLQLETRSYDVTILMIDDGSSDRTLEIVNKYAALDRRIRTASFSRNFGHQAAVAAAIDLAEADALIIMDSDMQHPPQCILEMVSSWEAGHEIVSMVRRETAAQTFLKKFTSRIFYRLFNVLCETKIMDGATEFFLLDAAPLQAARSLPEYHQFWRGIISWIGFRRIFLEYSASKRVAGISKYSMHKMIHLAFDGLTSFSARPMKLVIGLGLLTIALSFLYLVYILFAALFLRSFVPGWSSLIVVVIFFGGIQIATVGMVGAYIGKIFEQVKQRPKYILATAPLSRNARQ